MFFICGWLPGPCLKLIICCKGDAAARQWQCMGNAKGTPDNPGSPCLPAAISKEAPGADVSGEGAPIKSLGTGGWLQRVVVDTRSGLQVMRRADGAGSSCVPKKLCLLTEVEALVFVAAPAAVEEQHGRLEPASVEPAPRPHPATGGGVDELPSGYESGGHPYLPCLTWLLSATLSWGVVGK